MNKFEAMNRVLVSTLRPEDKALLVELILRADEAGESWPSVERLCQVRGIKHEKNFKGVDAYLPGLVSKEKRGRKNFYSLNLEGIMALPANEVTIRHTPALEGVSDTPAVEGVNTPAVAGNTPAVADNTPAVEGANSTLDSSRNSSRDSSLTERSFSKGHEVSENPSIPSRDEPIPSISEPMEAHPALLKINKKGAENLKGLLKATGQRTRDERETGRAHLEDLLEGKPELAEEARSLFEDNEWRPDRKGVQRAAWAVMTVESAAREEAMKRGA